MRAMAWNFDQTKLSVASGGHGGNAHVEIPDFPFETSLDQVSLLTHTTAMILFDLIYAKDTANTSIGWCIKLNDDPDEVDEVFDLFRSRSANLFLDVAALYRCMSQQVGWSQDVAFDHHYTAMMKSEVERFEKLKQIKRRVNTKSRL